VTTPPPRVLLDRETLALADELGSLDTVPDLVKLVSDLRKAGHPQDRIHHALEQVRLRRKARAKLGPFAARMLFTEAGLEQATRLPVAAHHAGRFQRAGCTNVADLGCGLGVDSMALAALGIEVTAVEHDELTAALATYNLAPFDNARVILADALDVDLTDFDAIWLDPARRSEGKRLNDPSQWSPTLTEAFSLAEKVPAGIKLAPGIDRDLLPEGAEWQWVSADGETVEVVVWTGALARPGVGRSALVISGDTAHELTSPTDSGDEPVGELGNYLFEPHGAIIRARLIGDLARRLGGRMVSPDIAYITTDNAHHTPFAAGFTVRRVLPYKITELKKWVREESIGTLEIKKRGVDVDPAALRKSLSLKGENQATLIITRVADKRVALVVSRLASPSH
jgi:protein-L-isoaspartate O-methyltransferase